MATSAAHQPRQNQAVSAYPSRSPGLAGPILSITAGVAFSMALIAAAVLAYGFMHRDQIYPGVSAAGIDLGGMSTNEAQAALDQRIDGYLGQEIILTHEDSQYTLDAASLGVEFDTNATIERARQVGRSGNWWNDSVIWFRALVTGHEVAVTSTVNNSGLESYLRSLAPEITVPAQRPDFAIAENGQLELTPASQGLGVDVAGTLGSLRGEVGSLGTGPVPIATVSVPPDYDEDAIEPLSNQMSEILSEPLVMEIEGYQWSLDPEQVRGLLSIEFDNDSGNAGIVVNHARLERTIANAASEARSPGRNSSVFWNGSAFEVRPAADGWTVDAQSSVAVVEQAILSAEHRVSLERTAIPAQLTTAAAEDAAEFGNELAGSRFVLRWNEGEAELGGSVIAATLTFESDGNAGEFVPSIDTEQLALFLSSVSNQIEVKPVNADLRYFNGEVVVVGEEVPGLEMDRTASAQAVADAVLAGQLEAMISVHEAEPDVTAAMASDVQIREMLSFGETYYGGSAANRRHNVEHSTRLANGALVPPGGEYSFVDSIGGEISVATGYELGFGIVGATDGSVSTVPSVGGGVCQVSTTVFQAAFWAGMPMVERNWHLYWMPLYGQPPSGITGLDATVDTSAGLDFRFTNTTDNWIAIVSHANGSAVRFEIWGTDPGWNVQASDPQISNRVAATQETQYEESDRLPAGTQTHVETAHDGFDVLIERRVYNAAGELIDELDLFSRYRPASNRVLIGTG